MPNASVEYHKRGDGYEGLRTSKKSTFGVQNLGYKPPATPNLWNRIVATPQPRNSELGGESTALIMRTQGRTQNIEGYQFRPASQGGIRMLKAGKIPARDPTKAPKKQSILNVPAR